MISKKKPTKEDQFIRFRNNIIDKFEDNNFSSIEKLIKRFS